MWNPVKYFKSLINSLLEKDDYQKKYQYVSDLFDMNGSWKDYPTLQGGVTGLTPLDIKMYLDNHVSDTTMVCVFKILKELETRQIITKASYTKDNIPIYRALVYFE